MDENERGRRPTVEVETVAPDIGIATLRGEHDLATKAALSDALARARVSTAACSSTSARARSSSRR